MQAEYAHRYMSPYHIALVYLGLGNLDQAYSWLDKAYDDRDPDIFMLNIEPIWKQQRNDARFIALLRKMRLKS